MSASRFVVLTEGYGGTLAAKTAVCFVRYREKDVVAVLDSTATPSRAHELLGVGADIPVIGTLAEAPLADALVIGIAPPGGQIPDAWRPLLLEAISRGLDIYSGLHEFLSEDAQFDEAARQHGVHLVDLRKNSERQVASGVPFREQCLRVHTVGNDCSCGKMVASLETARALGAAGYNAKFLATGQTGMLIEGDGVPIDCVVADFVNGAAERLVRRNEHHDIVVAEGQGSLFHPRYSGVTLGLLHGIRPHGLIYCYQLGRTHVNGMEAFELPPHEEVIAFYERAGAIRQECRTIAVAVNGRFASIEETDAECERIERSLGIPACDVYRHGPAKLVSAVAALYEELLGA